MVGAQGFEPRPAGIFWSATVCYVCTAGGGISQVGLPVDHHQCQTFTSRHSRATGASNTTRLYYTPRCINQSRFTAWLDDERACVGVASSYATSNAVDQPSSKHENLASWWTVRRPTTRIWGLRLNQSKLNTKYSLNNRLWRVIYSGGKIGAPGTDW